MTRSPPLTPDFIAHEAGPEVTGLDHDGLTLSMTWADGTRGLFNRFYLRENEVGPAINPVTRESDLDVDALPDDLAIEAAAVAGRAVEIAWAPDGHRSRHHAGWLWHVAAGRWRPRAGLPERQSWDAKTMPTPPDFDGPAVLSGDRALADCLATVAQLGLARLRNLPTAEGTVLAVARRIGTVRVSNFGFSFTVASKPDPDSNAYTSAALSANTDLATREVQPGLQLLHCRENGATGGASTMVDGVRVAEILRDRDPAAFQILTRRSWLFANRHRNTDYRWSGPIIRLDPMGAIAEIRNTAFLRAEPDMPDHEVDEAYRAYRAFARLAADPALICRTPFAPGDLVIFDNRRILHGREAFDPQSGSRRLEGCYLDTDELQSRLRVLNRPGTTA